MKLTADDYDSEENSAPFTYALSSTANQDIVNKFTIEKDFLYANVEFDREQQKFYNVPIDITDSGSEPQTGISILRVIIGDKNDNAARDGVSEIFVYNYKVIFKIFSSAPTFLYNSFIGQFS